MKAGRPLLLGLISVMQACVAQAAPAILQDRYVAGSFEDRVDLLVRDGYDHPDSALARLQALTGGTPAAQRMLLQARGMVEAQAGRAADAGEHAEQLAALAARTGDPLAAPAAALVRASVVETAGQVDVAAALARPALDAYQAQCRGAAHACDYRSEWRALTILERRALALGQDALARNLLDDSAALAERAGDDWRHAYSLGSEAGVLAMLGQRDAAEHAMAEARRIGAGTGDPALKARLLSSQAYVLSADGRRESAAHALEEGLALARRAHAVRLEAMLLTNLADSYAKLQRSEPALRAAEAGLEIARRYNDQRTERVLVNNAGLAKIGLGRIAEGKQDLARLLESWRSSGSMANEAQTLREFGEALAASGDARGALELYHRERAVTEEVVRRSREAALTDIRARDDAYARERNIDLLNRDNALKTATLANRTQLIRNWSSVVLVLAASLAIAVIMLRHVRRIRRCLEAAEARLRVQSERDALTNLANRRHLHAVMERAESSGAAARFEGTMLLVDVDHFKAINDRHGHAVGDAVLVEFGRRLTGAVRADDLVVRWGGEEFLIVARGLSLAHAHEMAARILEQISRHAFTANDRTLHVTTSIGYGAFPIAASRRTASWQQGLNLVDKALYTAKSGGRNRAMGLVLPSDDVPPGRERIAAADDAFQLTRPVDLLQTCGSV
ncbi:MAG: diguanylate cyclase [Proteobacteria bacterium]|nr:diguanylate cyclase [Pseudomonadota bacterium]